MRRLHRHSCKCGATWTHDRRAGGSRREHTCHQCGNIVWVGEWIDDLADAASNVATNVKHAVIAEALAVVGAATVFALILDGD